MGVTGARRLAHSLLAYRVRPKAWFQSRATPAYLNISVVLDAMTAAAEIWADLMQLTGAHMM